MKDNLFSITDILQEAHDFFKIEIIKTEIPTMRQHIVRTLKNKNIDQIYLIESTIEHIEFHQSSIL